IMQRLSEKDCSGFIRGGNFPGEWEFIEIPALIDDAYVAKLDPRLAAMVNSTVRDDKGRFSYWEYKEPLSDLLQLEAGNGNDTDGKKVSKYTFNSQYQQRPIALGGNIIHGQDFKRVEMLPRILYRKVFADTAQKTKEANDYSVFECWGMGDDGKIYLLDLRRGKWEAPQLRTNAIDFWNKQKADTTMGTVREMKVEDKTSGTGLIQDIAQDRLARIPVKGIERSKDKLTRVMDVVSYIEAGYVCVVEGSPFISDFIAECEAFTADDTHEHDDQIDPMCDAINDMLGPRPRGIFGNGVLLAQKNGQIPAGHGAAQLPNP
ncbi:MAG: phage terminase large subunit, partial [Burkholderiales bacterium]